MAGWVRMVVSARGGGPGRVSEEAGMGVEDEDLVAAGACPWVRGLIATVLVTG